jgi:hypothetical protein
MKAYRVLVQGECIFPDDGWRGFWVVREVRAEAPAIAEVAALAHVTAGWTGQAHGPITALNAVTSWPVGFWGGLARQPASGHTFYNDDADAERAALRMELKVARAPRRVRAALK